MKRRARLALVLAAAGGLAACIAPSSSPSPVSPSPPASDPRRSGFDFMSPQTQAIQRDDTQNPAMLWVAEGEALWNRGAGANPSCAGCHGPAAQGMRGVAARHPAYDARLRQPLNLQQRINRCRTQRQQASAWPAEHRELLSLEAYVALQSRGLPWAPPRDAALQPFRERGEALYRRRIGQLDLSCAQCHDAHAGARLAGNVIPQGHATGYPIYRLEWQDLGSLQRRIRNCMTGVRAEPYAYGAVELVELELFLAERARGLPVETPAVRP